MEIRLGVDKKKWNEFIVENSSPASFLQTWEWGEFQKALGYEIHRLEAWDGGVRKAIAQIIIRNLGYGKKYLEIPKGPVGERGAWGTLFEKIKDIAQEKQGIMLRINPPVEGERITPIPGFISPNLLLRQREPEDSILVDTFRSETDLFESMHEKARYNIRLATKKNVIVTDQTRDESAFAEFLKLIHETAQRDGITVWPDERFHKFQGHFFWNEQTANTPYAKLLTGKVQGQTLASAIIMFFGDSATYLYAASSAENRSANAASLVLWQAILTAKKAGKHWYDMWGVAPEEAGDNHSWAGITRFKSRYIKLGDTGKKIHYIGTWDMIIDKKFYNLFKLGKTIKSILKKKV